MTTSDKTTSINNIAHADLRRLSADQLQEQLEVYFEQHDDATALQLVRELVHELQVHQSELEMQNRELQESQSQLEEAREHYADLYEFAPMSYLTFDAAGCIREINLIGTALLGQERAHLLGKPFNLWLSRESGQAFFKHLKAARQSGQVEMIELDLQLRQGTPRNIRLRTMASPILNDDKPFYRSVVNDITTQKQTEREVAHQAQQLQLITDAIPSYIAYIDRHERYQFVNKAYAAWFQPVIANLIGKTVREVIGEDNYARVAHHIQQALAGEPVNYDISAQHPNGTTVEVNVHYIPDFASDDSVLGYFVVNQDMTEIRRREAEDKLYMLETARIARINTMGEMVAELAHELNQPLAAIGIYSDAVRRMLDKDTLDIADIQSALKEIRLQATRAGNVIQRLRDFVSKREMQVETVEINTLVEEVMKLIAVEARWHKVNIELELGEAIPPIAVDRILIEQVILNLARNAIEAMSAIDEAKRKLLIRTALGGYHEIELSVEDSGPGIPQAEMEKIFDTYYTLKDHGMGLGLSISRSIVRAHHGRIWVIPNEHGGAIFTFTLPYPEEDKEV